MERELVLLQQMYGKGENGKDGDALRIQEESYMVKVREYEKMRGRLLETL